MSLQDEAPPPATDGLPLEGLALALVGAGVEVSGPLTSHLISGGRSNLTFAVTDGVRRWVVRRPPLGEVLPGAHNVAREHRVMSALRDSAVPVPTAVLLCEDASVIGAPFYVMDETAGVVLRTSADTLTLTPSARRVIGERLVDVMADLHEVDVAAVGLSTLGRPDGYLRRQVDRWSSQLAKVQTREFPQAAALTRALGSTIPTSGAAALVHGDYRLDNVIVTSTDAPEIAAVLDWEMATLGDPLADLGTLLMFWDEPDRPFNPITAGLMALDGFPSRDEAVERYVSRRGLQVDDLEWYLVFAEFKLAVILEQIHARHRLGQTRGDGFDDVASMVVQLFASARERVERHPRLRAGA